MSARPAASVTGNDTSFLPSAEPGELPAVCALQFEMLEAIAAGADFASVAGLLCRKLAEGTPGLACAIALSSDTGTLSVPAASGLPAPYLRALDGVPVRISPDARVPGPSAAIDTASASGWEAFRAVPLPPGLAACWMAPMAPRDAGMTGAVLAFLPERRAPDTAEQQLLTACARIGTVALAEHALRSKLEQTKQLLDLGLDSVSEGVCFFDASARILFANRRLAEIFALRFEQIRPGLAATDLNALRAAAGTGPLTPEERTLNWRDTLRLEEDRSESFVELANGKVLIVRRRELPGGGWVATHQDITDRQEVESRIQHMARHDPLTGLANTVLFRERIEQTAAQSSASQCHAVLYLDLDRFKTINDLLGPTAADDLLQAAAGRLLTCVRSQDTVTRLGGDIFAVFAVDLAHKDHVRVLAERIVTAMAEPFQISGNLLRITASLGIALFAEHGTTPDDLLHHAEMALRSAKATQRGSYRVFEAEMEAAVRARLKLEHDLRRAVALNQFELHYQPLVKLDGGTITAFEALLRWRHPERGLVAPGDFIPMAEQTGLIVPLGEWVLEQACQEAARWPAHVTVAVNLSPVQFKEASLAGAVRHALEAAGLQPSRLELEITETMLLENNACTLRVLRELNELGVRISMDDFGTGHTSLSYLRSFRFDKLKIDQSFIRELSARLDAVAIVRAIVSLGHSLNIVTTAEGVETEDQLARLREEGCIEAQGFLFSRPVPAAAVSEMLREPHPFAAAQTV